MKLIAYLSKILRTIWNKYLNDSLGYVIIWQVHFICAVQRFNFSTEIAVFVLELLCIIHRIGKLFFFQPHRLKRSVDLFVSIFKISSPFFCRCHCLCAFISQVVDFANFTFGQNKERQRKLVYVGVDDSKLKVCFTMLFNSILKKFFYLFGMRNNFDALTAYSWGLAAGLLCHSKREKVSGSVCFPKKDAA